jgi:N-acetyl sugar amidotransferase
MIEKYKICTSCVMDTSDQLIKFNKEGICDHCQNFYKNFNNFLSQKTIYEDNELEKISKKIRLKRTKDGYDCLIGLSGGIDSSYLAHCVVKKMNLNPLVVHVDTGWNSKESVNNIEKIVDNLNLDLHTEVIYWKEMRDLQLSFFKASHPNLDIPQDHAIWASIHSFALKNNIKYLLTGGNFSTECIREPLAWSYHASDTMHIRSIQKKFGSMRLEKFPLCNIFTYRIYYKFIKGLRVMQPLNFINYNKSEAVKILQDNYGWINYSHKHYESRFTKFFEGYWLRKKFNYDVRKVHFSSLILTRQLTRKAALEKLEKDPYDQKDIDNEINYVQSKLNISKKEFDEYLNLPNKSFKDYKSYNSIIQFFVYLLRFLKIEKRLIR